jgi:predicted Zn finger-like uncharacterized protein
MHAPIMRNEFNTAFEGRMPWLGAGRLLEAALLMADLNLRRSGLELFLPALATPGPRPSEPPAGARFRLSNRSRGYLSLFYLSEPILFSCPSCRAKYKIVTIDSPGNRHHGRVACMKCNALFLLATSVSSSNTFLCGRLAAKYNGARCFTKLNCRI